MTLATTTSGKPALDGADRASSSDHPEVISIVTLVFDTRGDRAGRRAGVAFGLAIALYGGVLAVALAAVAGHRRGGAGSTPVVGARLAALRPIAISPPPPPPTPAPPLSPSRPVGIARGPGASPSARTAARIARSPRPVAPAEAAPVLTRPDAPVDLTAETVAVGTALAFPGGRTAGQGSGRLPAAGAVDLRGPAAGAGADAPVPGAGHLPRRDRPVTLAEGTWSCPWPPQADAAGIDAQTVVIRVRVGPSGAVEAVELVSDPGTGFGAAAAVCARRTRFAPARDAAGTAIAAWSPPIRVHFSR